MLQPEEPQLVEDPIPISQNHLYTTLDNLQVVEATDKNTGTGYPSPSAKLDTSMHKTSIIPRISFSTDQNLRIVKLLTKAGLVREEHVALLIFPI